MIDEHKDFKTREREIREALDPLLSLREVRTILGCSSQFAIRLIQTGKFDAFDITGNCVEIVHLRDGTHGLRITPSSLNAYLESTRVR